MIDKLLLELPVKSDLSRMRRVIFPDGRTGTMTVVSTRKGSAGSISYIATKNDDEEQSQCHLLVASVVGSNIVDIPESSMSVASPDPITKVLADRAILERVINLFPTVAARTMARTETPASNRDSL